MARINRNTRTTAAAAALALVSGTARIADEALKPVTKTDDSAARQADSDTRTGHALALEVIQEAQAQARGQWLRFVAKLVPMVPKARAAFMQALRQHRDDIKAHAKTIGTKVAENAANTANVWLSYMTTIASALNAGMSVDVQTDADGNPRHDGGGHLLLAQPFTHILAEARVFREAHAAQVEEGRVQAIAAAGIGITEEQARALVSMEKAAKRGRTAKPFADYVTEAAAKRGASNDDLKAAAAALLALVK